MNIVQIGCNYGNDHVFQYISENKDSISNAYLVEPIKNAFNLAIENYKDFPNVKLFNMAICIDENQDELELFTPSDEYRYEATSFSLKHVQMHFKGNDITSFKVPCKTISRFFDDLNLTQIDRLYIDTEGMDCKIIQTIDFNKYNIKRLQFEHIHSEQCVDFGNSQTYSELVQSLKNMGYGIHTYEYDTIAEKIS